MQVPGQQRRWRASPHLVLLLSPRLMLLQAGVQSPCVAAGINVGVVRVRASCTRQCPCKHKVSPYRYLRGKRVHDRGPAGSTHLSWFEGPTPIARRASFLSLMNCCVKLRVEPIKSPPLDAMAASSSHGCPPQALLSNETFLTAGSSLTAALTAQAAYSVPTTQVSSFQAGQIAPRKWFWLTQCPQPNENNQHNKPRTSVGRSTPDLPSNTPTDTHFMHKGAPAGRYSILWGRVHSPSAVLPCTWTCCGPTGS